MFEDLGPQLRTILRRNLSKFDYDWLNQAIDEIETAGTSRQLYLNYSLCGSKVSTDPIVDFEGVSANLKDYLKLQEANILEVSRIWMLAAILEKDSFFVEPVRNLIQIADKSELVTFLKYLILLPNPEDYQFSAVEALRTNIATVFNAISKHNPYPAKYFTEQQWNQMFLKAAFMQEDLGAFVEIDERANEELTRIISDYAHERWAASRTIDPLFWRPVGKFLNEVLIADMKRLFEGNQTEKKVAALCCHISTKDEAKQLLDAYPDLKDKVTSGELRWKTLHV